MRGNRELTATPSGQERSIPACAGEPTEARTMRPFSRVYPRVCGGTGHIQADSTDKQGLSPRVRGNLRGWQRAAGADRSIPACAGEPSASDKSCDMVSVYPRVCGGTRHTAPHHAPAAGLSPRVRGNRRRGQGGRGGDGSIPACAGEPARRKICIPAAGVYPRVCGGTALQNGGNLFRIGLSPRVRGNPNPANPATSGPGSIPACAGEPLLVINGKVG